MYEKRFANRIALRTPKTICFDRKFSCKLQRFPTVCKYNAMLGGSSRLPKSSRIASEKATFDDTFGYEGELVTWTLFSLVINHAEVWPITRTHEESTRSRFSRWTKTRKSCYWRRENHGCVNVNFLQFTSRRCSRRNNGRISFTMTRLP